MKSILTLILVNFLWLNSTILNARVKSKEFSIGRMDSKLLQATVSNMFKKQNRDALEDILHHWLSKQGFDTKSRKKLVQMIVPENIKVIERAGCLLCLEVNDHGKKQEVELESYSDDGKLNFLIQGKSLTFDMKNDTLVNFLTTHFAPKEKNKFSLLDFFISKAHAGVGEGIVAFAWIILQLMGAVAAAYVVIAMAWAIAIGVAGYGASKLFHRLTEDKVGGNFCCRHAEKMKDQFKDVHANRNRCMGDLTVLFENPGIKVEQATGLKTVDQQSGAYDTLFGDDHKFRRKIKKFRKKFESGPEFAKVAKDYAARLATCKSQVANYVDDQGVETKVVNDQSCISEFSEVQEIGKDIVVYYQCLELADEIDFRNSEQMQTSIDVNNSRYFELNLAHRDPDAQIRIPANSTQPAP